MRVCIHIFVICLTLAFLLTDSGRVARGDDKPGGKVAGDKSADGAENEPPVVPNVERPTTPATPPNAAELAVRPDAEGLVSFSFRGQPWPAVLEWLADVSDKSLEWQEAPPGFLDLTTRGKYSVPEVRDLINSVLLARGFTLLENGEMLLVVNVKQLDVSLVPWVAAAELDQRGRHELLRTSFDLERLRADSFVEELKPLLSPYGQVSALETTNRLDMLDTAGNLRRIRDLIGDEERHSSQKTEVREFRLKHAKAGETLETLKTLLGSKPNGGQVALTPEQQQQLVEQLKQMQQKGGAPKMPPRGDEAYLAMNQRENSILAHAPVDKLAVIAKAIEFLDVPAQKDGDGSLAAELPRMQRYELQAIDPEPIVRVLREMGTLDPTARLEIDKESRSIIVHAPLADHVTVRAVIDKLDVGGRTMEMIQLRRANVEYVAHSLEFLLRGADNERPGNTRRAQYATDRENNRLFLWANEAELADVRRLLVKLGEYGPNAAAAPAATQTIPLPLGKQPEEVLRELERLWPSMSPHPLEVAPPATPPPAPQEGATAPAPVEAVAETQTHSANDAASGPAPEQLALAVAEVPVDEPPASEPAAPAPFPAEDAGAPAPISVTCGPMGLVVSSDDAAALRRLKQLVGEITSNEASLRVFSLKNANAVEVATLLTNAYAPRTPASAKPAVADPRFRWTGFDDLQADDPLPGDEAPEIPIRFLGDPLTNTVLVQGASARRLEEIEELIVSYDRVPPADTQPTRKTQIVKIEYASAEELAKVIKDVFRDLLSPDDPAILANIPPDQRRMPYGYRGSASRDNRPQYKGLLSVGVNKELNTLVVSAPDEVMIQITSLIKVLDANALSEQPVAQVRAVKGIVHDPQLRAILNNALDPESESAVSVNLRGQGSERGDDGRRRSYRRGQ